ncbi:uncharacterized protein LOC142979554 isoform X2 [Anticarsia gemmatalis]|uniref:uncharacterized protein LOC142979554 isoform X2 n=1 Tax=Anticarsia gemmatalis TaxID=129554 RepID=UPI003F761B48
MIRDMSSIVFTVFVLCMFVCMHDCVIIRPELPNHSVEMQIEIHDQSVPPTRATPQPPRLFRVVNGWPKRKVRYTEKAPRAVIRRQAAGEEDTLPPTEPPPVTTTTTTPVTTTTTVATTPADPMKRPVYMEDLIKALDELEQRLEQKLKAITNNNNAPACAVPPQIYPRTVQNIDELLQILRKAVHIEKHVPKPNDAANLDWVQVKIPKARS